MVLLGGGLGLTTAPATESIMGSLSADKAGVGSAVNDTTRELGGTLGVAIVGSVFASVYSGRLGSIRQRSIGPPDLRRPHDDGALDGRRGTESSRDCRRALSPTSATAVNTAFLDGLQVGSLVSAGIALAAAVIVAWLASGPSTAGHARRTDQAEPEAVSSMSTTPTRGPTTTARSNTSLDPTDPGCGTSPQAAARRWC